jgi:Flp pilus assembly protein TadG
MTNPGGRRRQGGRRGVAALEFGLLAPVFMIGLAGMVDLGNALVAKFILEGSVSAAASFAMVNAGNVSAANGAALAANLGKIAANMRKDGWADSVATVNNGPTSTVTSGTAAASGTAANADSCYCPTGTAGSLTWGSAVACGSACASGATAGKFVLISASHVYTPIFAQYGFVPNGRMTVATLVQVQ